MEMKFTKTELDKVKNNTSSDKYVINIKKWRRKCEAETIDVRMKQYFQLCTKTILLIILYVFEIKRLREIGTEHF